MNHHEIVYKLIGPIDPVGETHVDSERLKNLDAMIHLVDRLLFDIAAVAKDSDSHMHSISFAGKTAAKFLESKLDQGPVTSRQSRQKRW